MAGLGAHLRQSEYHGRLPFHPDCPLCRRERVAGVLAAQPLIPRRTQAALAAGVLAFSAAAPGAAVAAVTRDQQQAEPGPEPGPTDDAAAKPDFDPGGPTSSLPDAPSAHAPTAPPLDDADSGPVDPEPTDDPVTPVSISGSSKQAVPPEPHAQSAPSPPATPGGGDRPPSAPPSQTPSTPSPPSKPALVPPVRAQPRHGQTHVRGADRMPSEAARPDQAGAATAETPATRSATKVTSVPATITAGGHAAVAQGQPIHVVVAGECLWSIARASVGGNASDAQIASQVHRLWELNKERIGTGNPNLLMVGTKLRVP